MNRTDKVNRNLTTACVRVRGALILLAFVFSGCAETSGEPGVIEPAPSLSAQAADGAYVYGEPSDASGTGKYYYGREIAHFMSHQGWRWLERPEREREERTDLLLDLLELEPGWTVADFGAGSGYFSVRIADRVAASGRVLAVDIQPEMLARIEAAVQEQGLTQVETILATATDPKLPAATVDLALLVDVYHELSAPREVIGSLVEALVMGGRLVLVEYRQEDPTVPIKRLHKMSEAQVRREMSGFPLRWVKTEDQLPRQHVIIFERVADDGV